MANKPTDTISSLAKGLRVIECFTSEAPRLAITDVARITGYDRATARRCLALLAGRNHRVFTGIALSAPGGTVSARVIEARVRMKRLSQVETDAYIKSGEWHGKAGGYAIQGRAAAFIPVITGSYSGVVGLPLAETLAMLRGAGYVAESTH